MKNNSKEKQRNSTNISTQFSPKNESMMLIPQKLFQRRSQTRKQSRRKQSSTNKSMNSTNYGAFSDTKLFYKSTDKLETNGNYFFKQLQVFYSSY